MTRPSAQPGRDDPREVAPDSAQGEAGHQDDNTVIVAYDGSPAARAAVVEAARLLAPCRMLIVTVWEPGLAYTTPTVPQDATTMSPIVDPEVARDVDRSLHLRAQDIAHEGVALAAGAGCRAQALVLPDAGDVSQTLLDLAEDSQASGIVVGSRGHSGLRARLEGSTSKALVKHARCPVLVVHEHNGHDH